MKRIGLPTLLLSGLGATAGAQNVDTSEWICEYCPFDDGNRADYTVGATSASDDSAYFGDATGYDEDGVYANVDGVGAITTERQRIDWRADDLGLDSRSFLLRGGQLDRYSYRLSLDELPTRRFLTTSTVFTEAADGTLQLPADWVSAGTTAGFTALDASLVPRVIESDRRTIGIGGSFKPTWRWAVSADFRRREKDGVRIWGASSFTTASLTAAPIDYTTDEVELGLSWRSARSFLALGWFLSEFENDNAALRWDQPFTASAGAETPAIAQAPDNRFQQLRLNGGYAWPAFRTVVNVAAAAGQIEQNAAFLPYTVNPNLATDPLPRVALDGEVDTTHLALSLNSRPIDKGRVRFSYRYDERDNGTTIDTWNRVIVDTFVSGTAETNTPYSYERSKLAISGDYDLFSTLRVGGGYERREIDRDFQEVASQTEDMSFARARWRPNASIEIEVRGGTAERDIDAYNEDLAADFGQNPLLRKYNLAYRFREFGELRASWSPGRLPIGVSVRAGRTDDDYTQSQLGLRRGREDRLSADLSWFIGERASAWFSLGRENLESEQLGSEFGGPADWRAFHDDRFVNLAAGFRVSGIADRLDARFSVMSSQGESAIDIDSAAGLPDSFPDLETDLEQVMLELRYAQSAALDLVLDLRYQRFDMEDWGIEGLTPAAAQQLLSLGATPYDDEQFLIGLGVRFRPGAE